MDVMNAALTTVRKRTTAINPKISPIAAPIKSPEVSQAQPGDWDYKTPSTETNKVSNMGFTTGLYKGEQPYTNPMEKPVGTVTDAAKILTMGGSLGIVDPNAPKYNLPVQPQAAPAVASTNYNGLSAADYEKNLLAKAQSGVDVSKNDQLAAIAKSLAENTSTIQGEQAAVDKTYQDSVGKVDQGTFQNKATSNELLNQYGWNPGSSGLGIGELNKIDLAGEKAKTDLEGNKALSLSDIARRVSLAKTQAENDTTAINNQASSKMSGAAADAAIAADARNNTQFDSNRNYELNKASTDANIENVKAGTEYQKLVNQGYPEEQALKMAQGNASLTGTNLQNDYQTMVNAGYPAEQAMRMAQAAANLAAINLSNAGQGIANTYAPQIAQGQIDSTKAQTTGQNLQNSYQTLINASYPKEEAAKINSILANTAGQKLSNEAQQIANKYAPQIAQGSIDSTKLQNAYQKLVNNGYTAIQAANIAATYANISQGNAQAAATTKNAATNQDQLKLERDKFAEEKLNANASGALYADMMKSSDPAQWLKDNGQYLTKEELAMLAPYAQPKATAGAADTTAALKSMGYTDAEIAKMMGK